MEILNLGGAGMLGHKLFQHLRQQHPETYCTIRGSIYDDRLAKVGLFRSSRVVESIDATDFPNLEQLLLDTKLKVVINCIGIVKHREEAKKAAPSIIVTHCCRIN